MVPLVHEPPRVEALGHEEGVWSRYPWKGPHD